MLREGAEILSFELLRECVRARPIFCLGTAIVKLLVFHAANKAAKNCLLFKNANGNSSKRCVYIQQLTQLPNKFALKAHNLLIKSVRVRI